MTTPTALSERCEHLRSLHVPGDPLLLPNAWDVASAKVVIAAGFPVVATTSGGIAAALGYEDHHGAPAGASSTAFTVSITVSGSEPPACPDPAASGSA